MPTLPRSKKEMKEKTARGSRKRVGKRSKDAQRSELHTTQKFSEGFCLMMLRHKKSKMCFFQKIAFLKSLYKYL